MSTNALELKEKKIRNLFNKQSSSYDLSVSDTAQGHIDIICDSNSKSVIDVGSGPGSLLIEMLENGVEVGIGIDLANEMNQIATKRLKETKIIEDRYKIIQGSFLELNKDNFPEIEDQYDAVSLHLVLCCHPDRWGMLTQTTNFKPKTIVLTVPRTWIFMKAIVGIWGIISRIRKKFRPYIHSQKLIDSQLFYAGYELTSRRKKLITVMSSYSLIESSDNKKSLVIQFQPLEEFP